MLRMSVLVSIWRKGDNQSSICSLTNCGADGMGRHCREKKRCRVMKQQGAPVLEPCDQCHNVNVECQTLKFINLWSLYCGGDLPFT